MFINSLFVDKDDYIFHLASRFSLAQSTEFATCCDLCQIKVSSPITLERMHFFRYLLKCCHFCEYNVTAYILEGFLLLLVIAYLKKQ